VGAPDIFQIEKAAKGVDCLLFQCLQMRDKKDVGRESDWQPFSGHRQCNNSIALPVIHSSHVWITGIPPKRWIVGSFSPEFYVIAEPCRKQVVCVDSGDYSLILY